MKLFPKEYLWQEIYGLICDAYKMTPSGLKNCEIWHSHKTRKPTEGQECVSKP
ncbi:hypothetical protein LEP1GSC187_1968 [Leptospira santarosai str. ZUN179]|uniref:Uncharacterized protein n=1 Tax=Leptospira santarosai str. ZUN179 TaxID=1049985 RepID=M6VCR2_9LEPT|nr:hypothetical protein LEP1GSC039_0660 [Leptospira santarosai str. 2000027870]EMO47313.1 hypothetical protein LEP1GSC187_1968 [Leptospira santarosai str. ZUN179]EMO82966.1 hypothetical protein LEP1GSC070_1367 [Leptospira santarosai str. AIM]